MYPNKPRPRKPAYRGDARTGWAIRRYNDIALGITDAHDRNSPGPDEELDDDYNDDEYVADEEEGEEAAQETDADNARANPQSEW
ncbi:hypothetical protein KCU83_g8826, partial [Aureobasidium melanogenum]